MSGKMSGLVFEHYPVGGGEMLTALCLADHADHDGTSIWPSVPTIAKLTRQSERTVQYHMSDMQKSGWLILVGNPKGGRKKSREYRINPIWIATGKLEKKGAEIAPFNGEGTEAMEPVDNSEKGAAAIAPFDDGKGATGDTKGCNPEQERVQSEAEKGATAIAPNPSLPVKDPSENRGALSKKAVEKSLTDAFEMLWAVYPKKSAKPDALKAYLKLCPDAELQAVLLAAVAKQAESAAWRDEGGKFIPYPATWINGQRWNDEVAPAGLAGTAATPAAADAWWETASGIDAKGAELSVQHKAGEDLWRYKVRVFKKAGDGKWRDQLLADMLRTKNSLYANVYEFFNGHPPIGEAA